MELVPPSENVPDTSHSTAEQLDDHLTTKEVARKLRLTENYVYQLARRKDDPMPSTRIGRLRRFSASQLKAWLAKKEKGSTTKED